MLIDTRVVSDGEIMVWSRLVREALAAQSRMNDLRGMSNAHVLMLKSTNNLYDSEVVAPIGSQVTNLTDPSAEDAYVVARFRHPLTRSRNFSVNVPASGDYFEVDYQQSPACRRIARHFGRLSAALSSG